MKIAVCDDDKLLTGEIDGQLQRIQQKMGISFETDIFFDGETLWEAIEKHGSYDIIYLDIEMENMDGITVARKIREQDPYTILLFVSSYDSYYEQLFEVEPLRFLRKPINPEKFEEYFKIAYGRLMNLDERLHFEFNKRLYQIPYRSIHCSYVVNYYYIKTFGASEVVLLNGEVLPVSIEYKNEAMKFYMDMAE